MDRRLFEQLERKYAQHASWAIWDSNDLEETAVIGQNFLDLKMSVVMVALNISGPLTGEWRNFHSRDHARKLMYGFNESPYRGAYMTDLIKGHVESSSARLWKRLQGGEIDLTPHLNVFDREIRDVGANNETLFVLFGDKVTILFKRHLAKKYPNHVSCPHYSMYGKGYTDAQWVENAWSILESNSRAPASVCNAPQFLVSARMKADLAKLQSKNLYREALTSLLAATRHTDTGGTV